MSLLFTVVDPRGITITCSKQQWQEHVLLEHGFMANRLDEVKITLENPLHICTDSVFKNRQCYYRMHVKGNRYMKVIVELISEDKAELVSAYQPDAGKKGERIIWPPSSN